LEGRSSVMVDNRQSSMDAPTIDAEQSIEPSLAECLEALERLVRNGALEVNSRGYDLLTYLIDHHLKFGPGVPIKAYSIAVDVLGRQSSFDPAKDSIARVEVGRLRKLLEMYFRGPGADDPIRFTIPRGQSHLEVARISLEHDPGSNSVPLSSDRPSPALRRSVASALVAALLVFGLAFSPILLRDRSGNAEVEAAFAERFPRIFVQPFRKQGRIAEAFPNHALSSFLAAELSAFKTFRVIGPSFPSTLPIRTKDFILEGVALASNTAGNQHVDLHLILTDGLGTVLWTETLQFDVDDWDGPEPVLNAISGIASTLGGAMGVIDSTGRSRLHDEMIEWTSGTASEFDCILVWQSFDLTKGARDRYRARLCLEFLAGEQTRVSQVWSALAFIRLLDWSEAGADPADSRVRSALEAANRALLLDPESADGHESLGSILTALGRLPEARETLARAMSINPSNLDTVVKIGWLDCLEGDWETGLGRIEAVMKRYSAVPGWFRLPLALGAYHQGDLQEMLRQANEIVASGDPRGRALAIVAARLLGDRREEDLHINALQNIGKSVPQAITDLGAVFPNQELIARLLEHDR
jgi:tetratricopeptide (TPR) repeat protein